MENKVSKGDIRKKSVLCVENSRVFTGYYAAECEARNLEFVSAASVVEALSKVESCQPSAILCSGHFRGLPGISLVSALKCSFLHRAIPVALVTAEASSDEREGRYDADTVLVRNQIREELPVFFDEIGLTKNRFLSDADEKVLRGKRILLAEDSSVVKMLVGKILHVAGAEVVMVDHGRDALTAATQDKFDMILMDIEMPVMNGDEAAKRMRERKIDIPILALTGRENMVEMYNRGETGFDGVLQKPVTAAHLLGNCAERLRLAENR